MILTIDDHALDHEVLVPERGHSTLVLPRQSRGRHSDVEGAVHGGGVLTGSALQHNTLLQLSTSKNRPKYIGLAYSLETPLYVSTSLLQKTKLSTSY